MKIDILATDGSPLGVTEQSIYGIDGRSGVGGAELAILTLCRGWHNRGHDVTFYNDPHVRDGSVFRHKRVNEFQTIDKDRDILIVFRSPNPAAYNASGKKIWFSTDQRTIGNFAEFSTKVDVVVGISEFHKTYFRNIYGIHNMRVIDIPVRDWEYPYPSTKVPKSCIFTSVPDRGLMELLPIWNGIIEREPEASLTITSDWSLWTGGDMSHAVSPYRLSWSGKKNVSYMGAVSREKLIQIQSSAEFHLYPCIYDELFCISVAESQVAGAIPVTSSVGALETTNRLGHKIKGIPTDSEFIHSFVDMTVNLMSLPLPDIRKSAIGEFGLEKILDEWEKVFNE